MRMLAWISSALTCVVRMLGSGCGGNAVDDPSLLTTHRGFASGECAGKAGELGWFTNSREKAK